MAKKNNIPEVKTQDEILENNIENSEVKTQSDSIEMIVPFDCKHGKTFGTLNGKDFTIEIKNNVGLVPNNPELISYLETKEKWRIK